MSHSNNANTGHREIKIPVVDEDVTIQKETRVTGQVEVHKDVHIDHVRVPLTHTSLQYKETRVPINKVVAQRPGVSEVDGKIIIPVIREEEVVTKRLVLVEEIHLTPHISQQTEEREITLRSESARVERS